LGCFLETLARFRVDVELRAALAEIVGPDDGHAAGIFAAIGTAESLARLRAAPAAEVVDHGLDDLDAAPIRMSFPRTFTQAVSRYIYDSARLMACAIVRDTATKLRIGQFSSRSRRCSLGRPSSPSN
jgi:hypothetical protein